MLCIPQGSFWLRRTPLGKRVLVPLPWSKPVPAHRVYLDLYKLYHVHTDLGLGIKARKGDGILACSTVADIILIATLFLHLPVPFLTAFHPLWWLTRIIWHPVAAFMWS